MYAVGLVFCMNFYGMHVCPNKYIDFSAKSDYFLFWLNVTLIKAIKPVLPVFLNPRLQSSCFRILSHYKSKVGCKLLFTLNSDDILDIYRNAVCSVTDTFSKTDI